MHEILPGRLKAVPKELSYEHEIPELVLGSLACSIAGGLVAQSARLRSDYGLIAPTISTAVAADTPGIHLCLDRLLAPVREVQARWMEEAMTMSVEEIERGRQQASMDRRAFLSEEPMPDLRDRAAPPGHGGTAEQGVDRLCSTEALRSAHCYLVEGLPFEAESALRQAGLPPAEEISFEGARKRLFGQWSQLREQFEQHGQIEAAYLVAGLNIHLYLDDPDPELKLIWGVYANRCGDWHNVRLVLDEVVGVIDWPEVLATWDLPGVADVFGLALERYPWAIEKEGLFRRMILIGLYWTAVDLYMPRGLPRSLGLDRAQVWPRNCFAGRESFLGFWGLFAASIRLFGAGSTMRKKRYWAS